MQGLPDAGEQPASAAKEERAAAHDREAPQRPPQIMLMPAWFGAASNAAPIPHHTACPAQTLRVETLSGSGKPPTQSAAESNFRARSPNGTCTNDFSRSVLRLRPQLGCNLGCADFHRCSQPAEIIARCRAARAQLHAAWLGLVLRCCAGMQRRARIGSSEIAFRRSPSAAESNFFVPL